MPIFYNHYTGLSANWNSTKQDQFIEQLVCHSKQAKAITSIFSTNALDKAKFSVNHAWLVGFPRVTINFEHKEKQYPPTAAADRKEAKTQEYYHRTSSNEYALYPLTLHISLKMNCIQD
jgi:hypothetical protein